MKKIFLFLMFWVAVLQFVPVDLVLAQEVGLSQLSQCSGTDCSACNAVHLANGIIKWLIGILFIVFAILVAIAGVRLVVSGGNHHALDEAKGMFLNAIIGFIIILSAWLIVDTIMRALVGTENRPGQLAMGGTATGYLFWSQVQCQRVYKPEGSGQETLNYELAEPNESVDTRPMCGPNQCVPGTPGPAQADSSARAQLIAAGIGIKSNVSLEGIRPHVISAVIALNKSCGCSVYITSGTDGSHQSGTYSHTNGYKLDLRTNNNPTLLSYVRSLTSAGTRSDGAKLYTQGKNTYAIEGDHVDVQFLP